MIKKLLTILIAVCIITPIYSQKKEITLKDIWREYTFYPSYISGFRSMNDGEHYSTIENNNNGQEIIKYNIT